MASGRWCSRCRRTKPVAAFGRKWVTLASGERKAYIRRRTCQACYSRRWRRAHPEQAKATWTRQNRKALARVPEVVRLLRDHIGQHVCRYCDSDKALHFHHRDPSTKRREVVWAIRHGYSLEWLKCEAAKCDVACRWCHILIHRIAQVERRIERDDALLRELYQRLGVRELGRQR